MHTIFLHVELDDILMAAYKNVSLDLGGGWAGGTLVKLVDPRWAEKPLISLRNSALHSGSQYDHQWLCA